MRAAIMMSLAYFATLMGWQYSSLNNLAIAGVVLIVARPSIVFEVGPQLSFVAVAVLILTAESLTKRKSALKALILTRETKTKRVWRGVVHYCVELLRTSFWVWFITAPIVWTGFHIISPIGILLNLVLWIPMLIALVTGLGMILVGWLPFVGELLGFLCGTQLWLVDLFVDWGEQVPLGHFWLPAPPILWMVVFYAMALIVIAMIGSRRLASRRLIVRLLALWFLFGLLYNPVERTLKHWFKHEANLTLTFLDVGHGTNVWIETPDDQLWLYDAGRLGDHERSYRRISDALWYQGFSSIDRLVLSHADSDHYNAMPGLLKRFRVKRFLTTTNVTTHKNQNVQSLLQSVKDRGIELDIQHEGWHYRSQEWNVVAIHPPEGWKQGSDNAASLCLLLEFAGRTIFLPGDLEPPGLTRVLDRLPASIDVIMAPHHGSLNSETHELLDQASPEFLIISGSQKANTEKVMSYFEKENREIFLTARDHAIRVLIRRDGSIEVLRWADGEWKLTKSQDR
jgi:competence protein ComEC